MPDYSEFFGWSPNPEGVNKFICDPSNTSPVFNVGAGPLLKVGVDELVDTFLYEPLVWATDGAYRRGAQGIGDCVSWGAEIACTLNLAMMAMESNAKKRFCQVATEPIYGGSRVEARGRKSGGWSDGSYGAAAADWVKKWGVLLRKDYSAETGNPEHNLLTYDSKKAKNWGNYGNGGQNDKDTLDEVARQNPLKIVSQVNSFDDCARAIALAHSPVTIASSYGCSMKRDKNGFCKWSGSWPHQMCLIGVRFGSQPGCLCAQSWGHNSASGPVWPENMPECVRGWTWWIPAADVDKICRSGDCWAFGRFEKWKIDRFNWANINQPPKKIVVA